jgi:hypothetical protein
MLENNSDLRKAPFLILTVVVLLAAFGGAYTTARRPVSVDSTSGGFLGAQRAITNKCHATLPCVYQNQIGTQVCVYAQNHNGHRAGSRCP